MANEAQKAPEGELEELRAKYAQVCAERDALQSKLEALLHQVFGKRSERFVDDGHPTLPFDDLEEPPPPAPPHVDEAPDDEDIPDEARSRKPRRRGATRLPDNIKRVVDDVEPSEEQKICFCCGKPRKIIGYEKTEKLEYQPACCFLRVIRRPKLACPDHEEAGVTSPALPPQVIDKGLAGASMLAQVMTAKYRDHLPLYRQAGIYARGGVDIPETTLCDWVRQTAELLDPVVAFIASSQVMTSGYVSTDDTGVTLLTKDSPKKSKRAHLWAYLGEQLGDVVFDFTPGRGGEGPKRMLDGFEGYLQADAYSVYDALFQSGKIVEVGCMAHARRKFFDSLETAPEQAKPAMQAIKALYRIERECKADGLSHDERHAKRATESRDTFDALREWLVDLKSQALPKSPIGKAARYFTAHAEALGRFLENGRLEIDNNRCERAMRQVAVGRKNWLFAGSEAGGQRAATLYSLTVGCWELGLDPFAYLSDVLARVGTTDESEMASLTPRGWFAEHQG